MFPVTDLHGFSVHKYVLMSVKTVLVCFCGNTVIYIWLRFVQRQRTPVILKLQNRATVWYGFSVLYNTNLSKNSREQK